MPKLIISQKIISINELNGLKNMKNGVCKISQEYYLQMKVIYVAQNKAYNGLEKPKIKIGQMI